jgi:hypothetical protein
MKANAAQKTRDASPIRAARRARQVFTGALHLFHASPAQNDDRAKYVGYDYAPQEQGRCRHEPVREPGSKSWEEDGHNNAPGRALWHRQVDGALEADTPLKVTKNTS